MNFVANNDYNCRIFCALEDFDKRELKETFKEFVEVMYFRKKIPKSELVGLIDDVVREHKL